MSEEEENQTGLYSLSGIKKGTVWPKHFYNGKKRDRSLAFLQPLYDEKEETIGYRIITEHERWSDCYTPEELIDFIIDNNVDVYITKLYGRSGGFIWLAYFLNRAGVTAYIASSSKTLVTLSIKVGRRTYKIINASNWQTGIVPTETFLLALRNIFTACDIGVYPSPSGLGHALLLDCMQQAGISRIYRPGTHLRERLKQYSSGGRADDFTLARQYKTAYEIDRNNSYAVSASDGVPSGRLGHKYTLGIEDVYDTESELLREIQNGTSYCQAQITIPDSFRGKFSPFYIRTMDGLLEWCTKPGTYTGYWWYPMLKRCIDIGFSVSLGLCYVWSELDTFLRDWTYKLIELRNIFKASNLKLEEQIAKGIIVSSIGRFGMSTETLTLVTNEHRQEQDDKWLNLQAQDGESLDTPYFVHKEIDINANHLNQIASYIICQNNCVLYDEMVEQERLGNTVYASNFDAFFAEQPYIGVLNGWKQKEHTNWQPTGKRSYESYVNGTKVRKKPGKRKT